MAVPTPKSARTTISFVSATAYSWWCDELRAIKHDLAMCTDTLPWLLLPERGGPMACQAINYLITARERVGLPGPHPNLPEGHKLCSHVFYRLSRADLEAPPSVVHRLDGGAEAQDDVGERPPKLRMPILPFKLSQGRRHHISHQQRKVTNWPAYDASLRQRGRAA